MFDPSTPAFPNNVISLLQPLLGALDSDITTKRRSLRNDDPNYSIGLYPVLHEDDPDTLEMGHSTPHEPTLSKYTIGIQAFVKDGDEERGTAVHTIMSQKIRSVLYRSTVLAVSLSTMQVSDSLSTERVQRWGVSAQRFLSLEVTGTFLYLSTIDFWLETEVR